MTKILHDSLALVAAAFLPLLLLNCAAANSEYIVGDSTGWRVPTDPNFYSTWASSKTFHPNDVLVFNFVTNVHDVVQVPKESYDSCSPTNAINKITTGPANVTLTPGNHYYICTIDNHCQEGQKLSVSVSASSSSMPSPSPSPSSTTPASPPPSSAPPRVVGGFFLVLFSFALGKMIL